MQENSQRIAYLDLLRIIAAFSVIILHVSCQHWDVINVHYGEWFVLNIFNGISRFGVPVFVMISGALFLSKEIKIKNQQKKIVRLLSAFVFWSILYSVREALLNNYSLMQIIVAAIYGPYHLWFIFMIIGLYLVSPFIKKILDSPELSKYYLLILTVFSVILPTLIHLLSHFSPDLSAAFNLNLERTCLFYHNRYVFPFVLGYLLSKHELQKKHRYYIYASSLLGFVLTVFLTCFFARKYSSHIEYYFGYLTINVLLEAAGVFTFVKYAYKKLHISQKLEKILYSLSKYTFGAYLVHLLIIWEINRLGLTTSSFNAVLSVPVIVFITTILSFSISAILNKIPLLNKYIV